MTEVRVSTKHTDRPERSSRRFLRILAINYEKLGVELYVENHLRQFIAIAKRGHEVTCLYVKAGPSQRNLVSTQGFKLEALPIRKVVPIQPFFLFELMAIWRIVRSISHYDAVIVDIISLPILFPIFLIRRIGSRLPCLFLRITTSPVDTGGQLRSFSYSAWYAFSIRLAASLFDKIFFISPMMGRSYSDQLHIPKSKLGVWPTSVDTGVFDPASATEARSLREELGLSDRVVVLYHGVLSRNRGILETIEAFRILREKSVSATFVILGFGPLMNEFRDFVRANRLDDVVKIRGPVDYVEVPRYVAACDVGIVPLPDHPWWRYQSPIKVLECLAMNKPLIVSDIPANRWIIGDAAAALYLSGTSPEKIADGVQTFLTMRGKLDPNSGRDVASRFSVENIAQHIEEEINYTVRGGSSPNVQPPFSRRVVQ
jgi:glycosyltransferase involved in cell wall biosynthesis